MAYWLLKPVLLEGFVVPFNTQIVENFTLEGSLSVTKTAPLQ